MTGPSDRGPLEGIRVVELATVLMAPYASQLLADLGADVIKVESAQLDASRIMGGGPHEELSGVAVNLHRNKRSIRLDLKLDAGSAVLKRLLSTADIFLTNMRPGALTRLALDYESLARDNPRLVYCEAHGYASESSEAERPALDDIIQAETGLPRLAERIGNPVRFLPSILADKVSGLTLAYGALGALVHQQKTGRGQRVELSMFDSVLAFNLVEHLGQAAFGDGPAGHSRILNEYRGPHRTKDGYVALTPYSDRDWRVLYEEVGHADELTRPEFANGRTRHHDAATVYESLAAIVAERTTEEWVELGHRLGIAVGRVPTIDEIVSQPELHRGVLGVEQHPVVGEYRSIASPVRFSATPWSVRRHAPVPGADTVEILKEAGLTDSRIAEIIATGAAWPADAEPERDS